MVMVVIPEEPRRRQNAPIAVMMVVMMVMVIEILRELDLPLGLLGSEPRVVRFKLIQRIRYRLEQVAIIGRRRERRGLHRRRLRGIQCGERRCSAQETGHSLIQDFLLW